MTLKIESFSPTITKKIGAEIAQQLTQKKILQKEPIFILLEGNLGAGKTTFTMGFLHFFGIKPKAASPTFTIMKRYCPNQNYNQKQKLENNINPIKEIYHIDAYRLQNKRDLELIGFNAIKKQPYTVVLIEWPGNVKGLRLKNIIKIKFEYGKKEKERVITIHQ